MLSEDRDEGVASRSSARQEQNSSLFCLKNEMRKGVSRVVAEESHSGKSRGESIPLINVAMAIKD